MRRETVLLTAALVLAAGTGLSLGYLLWGWPTNWYAVDVTKLGPGPENDLIRYGRELVIDTPRHIGREAADPSMRFAGNDLACQSCHLNAGLQPFGAPFISTFATFPMMVDDQVLTLTERINGCMLRSMNGKRLPDDSREMNALIAYMKFVGQGAPESVRVAGMGLRALAAAEAAPDATRGEKVYAQLCVTCHKADGQGERRSAPAVGYAIPPLWGDASFNEAAGMSKLAYAAAYIRANMPFGVDYEAPVLTVQQAWDVAAYMVSKPRPPAPADAASSLR